MQTQNLMRIQQAAGASGLHPATLYKLIKEGKITKYAAAVGRHTYVDLNEITALMQLQPTRKEGPSHLNN